MIVVRNKPVANLADPGFASPEASVGRANQVFAVGFLVSIPADRNGQPAMQQGALGEECVAETGNVITYTCPTITSTVTVNGDSFELDITIIPQQGGWKSMHITGTITLVQHYSNGRLYFEVDSGTQSAMMTCDYEAWCDNDALALIDDPMVERPAKSGSTNYRAPAGGTQLATSMTARTHRCVGAQSI